MDEDKSEKREGKEWRRDKKGRCTCTMSVEVMDSLPWAPGSLCVCGGGGSPVHTIRAYNTIS